MDIDNSLLGKATISADRRPSSSTKMVSLVRPKRISAKTERLIGELGLRYRPSAQADLNEHAAQLALLITDVGDVPPDLLERAIADHVRKSHFMPKASELIALAQSYLARPSNEQANPDDLAERYNARLRGEGRFDIAWKVEGDTLKLDAA